MTLTISITPARYAKGKFVVSTPSDGSGFKTRAMFLVERLGGRWVHRDHGYQVTARQARRIERAVRLLARLLEDKP